MSEPVSGGGIDKVALGEFGARERPCTLVFTVALVGKDLDIASDDDSLSWRVGESASAGEQPVLMPFRGGFLGAAALTAVAASGFGRSCGARGRAREGRPASRWNWRGLPALDPARTPRRAWARVRVAESDEETAASGTEFPLGGLGSGVLRSSIFRGSEEGRRREGRVLTGQCTSTTDSQP